MKRSEMLHIIENELQKLFYFKIFKHTSKSMAKNILNIIEEPQGYRMLPPLVGDDFADIRDYYWESENV